MRSVQLLFFFLIVFKLHSQEKRILNLPSGLNEISGIALSSSQKVFAFVHNDSGDTSRFFGIDSTGSLAYTYYFKGVSGKKGVTDCEDITIGKTYNGENRYLYIGDIGDNKAKRKYITVYRIAEPDQFNTPVETVSASPVFLTYPDGARDAETLMVDNIQRLLYIISKREDTVRIYTAPLAWNDNDTITLKFRGQIYFKGSRPGKWITSGDISWDGQKVLLKSLQKVYYWERKNNEPLWKTLQRTATELPYQQESQGEAICFDREGKGFYTVSEGEAEPVYHYKISR